MRETVVQSTPAARPRPGRSTPDLRKIRLLAEMVTLYIGVPLVLALALPASTMFTILLGVTVLGLALLHLTPGFHWHDLLHGWHRIEWPIVLGIGVVTLAAGSWLVFLTNREAWFGLLLHRPGMMITILLLYPLLSALPQELVFRPLFFRRYAEILPATPHAILLNAALFSFAHLLYWSWIVAAMTFVGGIAFAWAYEVRRNFPMAVALHAVSGSIVFIVGLGMFFYSGNIVRPF